MAEKQERFGRLANRRTKLLTLSARYSADGDDPTAQRYEDMAAEIRDRLLAAQRCIACGRPLRNIESIASGIGSECLKKDSE